MSESGATALGPARAESLRAKLIEQPRGVYLLVSTEVWERFSYYGMLGLLVLFLVAPISTGGFGWTDEKALRVFGLFLGLTWFAPIVGGWIADHVTGARVAVIWGCASLALGNFFVAGCALASSVMRGALGVPIGDVLLFIGLALMVIGAGLFKSNVSVLMGGLFPAADDPRRDFGFILFYIGINVGALLAPLVAGTLGERVGWYWGFAVSGLGMLIGIVVFLLTSHRVLGEVGLRPRGKPNESAETAAPEDAGRVATIGVFALFATVFAVGLMQYGGLLNLFTAQNVDRSLGGFKVPATWFLMLNPLCIVLLGPLVAFAWDKRLRAGLSASSTDKFAVGLALMAAAFGLVAWPALDATSQQQVHWLWIVAFYLVLTTGELCIYPVGLALVSRLSPRRWIGVLMGAWLLTYAVGSWIAGELGVIAQKVGNATVFGMLALVAAVAAVVLWSVRQRLVSLARTVP